MKSNKKGFIGIIIGIIIALALAGGAVYVGTHHASQTNSNFATSSTETKVNSDSQVTANTNVNVPAVGNVNVNSKITITDSDIKNLGYDIGSIGGKSGLTLLNDGKFSIKDGNNVVGVQIHNYATGDINHDGTQDAVVVLTLQGGNAPIDVPYAVINMNGTLKSFRVSPNMDGDNSYTNISKVVIDAQGKVFLTYRPNRFTNDQVTTSYSLSGNALVRN